MRENLAEKLDRLTQALNRGTRNMQLDGSAFPRVEDSLAVTRLMRETRDLLNLYLEDG